MLLIIKMQLLAEVLNACLHDEPDHCAKIDFCLTADCLDRLTVRGYWELYRSLLEIYSDWHRNLLTDPMSDLYKERKQELNDISIRLNEIQTSMQEKYSGALYCKSTLSTRKPK